MTRAQNILLALALCAGAWHPVRAQATQPAETQQAAVQGRAAWTGAVEQAAVLTAQGRYPEAAAHLEEAIKEGERARPDHPALAALLGALGQVQQQLGRFDDAERALRRALAITQKNYGAQDPEQARALSNLGSLYLQRGQRDLAELYLRRAYGLLLKTAGPEDVLTAGVEAILGKLALERHRYSAARPMLEHALAVFERQSGPKRLSAAFVLNNLALVTVLAEHDYDGAAVRFTRAVSIVEKALGSDHPLLIKPLTNLADCYGKAGRTAEAELNFKRAWAIAETLGAEHPSLGDVLSLYAKLLRKTNRRGEARQLQARAQSILDAARVRPDHTVDFRDLGASTSSRVP